MFLAEKNGELLTVSRNRPGDDVASSMAAFWRPDRIVKLTTLADHNSALAVFEAGGMLQIEAFPSTTVVALDEQNTVIATYTGELVYP